MPRKCTVRKRVEKGKKIVMEGESDTSDESWEGDSETDGSVSISNDYGGEDSDEEFAEIRKEMAELKKNRRLEEEEHNKWVVGEHERMRGLEEDEHNKWLVSEHKRMQSQDNNSDDGSNYNIESEDESEEDEEFAYTEPRCAVKKRVNKVFNNATPMLHQEKT